jgi:autotransporter-associated beta strand protein
VPAEGTNAVIGGGNIVNYNLPMAATSFGTLNLSGSLTINTNGFVIYPGLTSIVPIAAAPTTIFNVAPYGVALIQVAGTTTIPVGAVLTNNGSLTFSNTGPITLPNAGTPVTALTFNAGSVFTMTNTTGSAGINVGASSSSQGAVIAINGGTVTFDKLLTVAGVNSRVLVSGGTLNCLGNSRINDTSNDGAERINVSGGVANIGNFSVARCSSAGGLVVANGVVNATGIQIQTGNSMAFATINNGGIVTNTGVFTVSDTTTVSATGDRRAQFLVRGGTVVSTGAGGIVLANQSSASTTPAINNTGLGGVLDINAGSVTAEMITLIKDPTITNAYARLNLSGTGIIYLGSGGLVANTGPSRTAFNIALSGGTMAAKADWSSAAPMALSGTVTFQAADASGAAHTITLSNQLTGSGAILTKTGLGTLATYTNNTYSGNTLINAGTLKLGAGGSLPSTPQIILASGAFYDVSAGSGSTLVGSQALIGLGAVIGNLTAGSGTSIRPAGNTVAGTLTFSNALTETGGVVNNFDLSDDPTGLIKTNDFINIVGDLNLSGTNTIQVNPLNGPLPGGATYKLIQYAGNFNGGITNLVLNGAAGLLTNDAGAKVISLVVAAGIRPPTNVVWLGGLAANNWDLLATSNWLNGVSRDYFVAGDFARFDDTGSTNPVVNVLGSVVPGSMTVDTASNYTFTGSGSIDGGGGLTKTNSGALTILTTNNYLGSTVIGGGTLSVIRLANGGAASSIGTSSKDPSNLVFYGSSLRHLGASVTTDRGATLNSSGATIEVSNSAANLTFNGPLTGPGNLTKAGPGALILGVSNSFIGTTTISNGTLQINDANSIGTNAIYFSGGNFTMNASGQPTYVNPLNVLTNTTINSSGGNNNIITGPMTGTNTVNIIITSGGTFSISTATFANFAGGIALGTSAGTFRFNSGGGSPCTGSPTTAFDLGTSTASLVNRNGAGLTYHLGALSGGSGTILSGAPSTDGFSTYSIGAKDLSTTFAGTISQVNTARKVSILKVGAGTLTLSGNSTYTGTTAISNGAVAFIGNGSISNTPSIQVVLGTVLDVSGRTDGTVGLNSGQTLVGEGTVNGSVTVRSSAILSPGDSGGAIGTLTITNNLVLQSGSTLNMDLDYDQALGGGTNDLIQGLASVTYGGTLSLNITTIETNSIFKLFSAAVYSGAFDTITPATPPTAVPGLVWDTHFLTMDGTLRITRPRPGFGSITQSGTDLIFTGTNGMPFAEYHVLASTDVALPVNSWTSIYTNTFAFDGTFNFTNAIDPNVPKEFIILQAP